MSPGPGGAGRGREAGGAEAARRDRPRARGGKSPPPPALCRGRYLEEGIGNTISAARVGLGTGGASAASAPVGPPCCPAGCQAFPGLRPPLPPLPVTRGERDGCFPPKAFGEEGLEA